ncbi:FkbM family methyltransferase [Arsukibacterium perlucidum]|uniref:FkbM family methyltransferase n=1 Tax=Arsukibacterium perlucidum TaxID=368811 RepID=UPI000370702D|nr:FkbM family methyltransferase [Arsukibacterium perlucidum]
MLHVKLDKRKPNLGISEPPKGFILSDYGILMRKNWFDATFHFCKRGSYDNVLSDYLNYEQSAFIFVDIGANQGLYSILAGKNKYCKSAYAFEPVASTFSLLEKNILANQVSDNVIPIQAAVSSQTGNTTIIKKFWHSGAATLRKLPNWFRYSESIATLGPDKLAVIIPKSADLIVKVDVEGHENIVFEALAESGLLSNTKAMYYEIDRRWSDERGLETLLRTYGFTKFEYTSSKMSCDVLATR